MMRIRSTLLVLLIWTTLTGVAVAAPVETGFLDEGMLWFRGVELEQRATLSGAGMVETGTRTARIALNLGGYLEIEPNSQVRFDVDDKDRVSVTVIRGRVILETTASRRLSAGRNSMFYLDLRTVREGAPDEPDFDDDRPRGDETPELP